jgi:hypothetical protein
MQGKVSDNLTHALGAYRGYVAPMFPVSLLPPASLPVDGPKSLTPSFPNCHSLIPVQAGQIFYFILVNKKNKYRKVVKLSLTFAHIVRPEFQNRV